MGSLFRSQEMSLCQIFLPYEAAYFCVSRLGELGVVQFRDLNKNVNAFQKRFINEVRRCDEMERKLRVLEKEIKKDNIAISDLTENPEVPHPREMIDMEAKFEKMETEVKEVNSNAEALQKTYCELTELKYVLQETESFFQAAEVTNICLPVGPTISGETASTVGFVTGIINRDRIYSLERMLWRISRGNVYVKFVDIKEPIKDPVTGDDVNKCVIFAYFHGEQLKTRVKKICESFRATLYPCPETIQEREKMLSGVNTRMEDLKIVFNQTNDHRKLLLEYAAKDIASWTMKVQKVKAIYHTLNLFNHDVARGSLIAECWCAVSDMYKVHQDLIQATEQSGSYGPAILNRMETNEPPPTYNRLNKFTKGFQGIVDAYGVAEYGEVNPALYTIITFPFLFAVMFGDCGHGLLMALMALWMVLQEKKIISAKSNNEMFNMLFGGRYIVLLMGIFSIYTGLIYNDCFSKSLKIFEYSWMPPDDNGTITLHPVYDFKNVSYPFGIDPVWQNAGNKIVFLNSYKMKVSIIFGVCQMVFGVILSLFNHIFFKSKLSIFGEFIPQMIFLCAIFGYLVILIFMKWIIFNGHNAGCASSLLIMLINMFMFKYNVDICYLTPMYTGQQTVQTILVLVALLCIPWMLITKPLVLFYLRKKSAVYTQLNENGEPAEQPEFKGMGEIIIDQAIHTIEYCLGSVSHTASYLRLWALSLAHAQLSEVLWSMVMTIGFRTQEGYWDSIVLYVIFAAWAVLTIGVLLIMEGLSAFLHALRLHWVEFQSKFYKGTGYIFVPFSFAQIIETANAEKE